jgi:hypothetical protein
MLASTIAQRSQQKPADFVTAAVKELGGTSPTAEYGPPYNHSSGSVQHFLFLHPQRWLGVSHPIDTEKDFVVGPLETIPNDLTLTAALAQYKTAPDKQKKEWAEAYAKPLEETATAEEEKKTPPGTVSESNGLVTVKANGSAGPVPVMMARLLALAKSGGSTAVCSRASSSSRPTTPSRCCSWPTADCSQNAPNNSTCSASSGA